MKYIFFIWNFLGLFKIIFAIIIRIWKIHIKNILDLIGLIIN